MLMMLLKCRMKIKLQNMFINIKQMIEGCPHDIFYIVRGPLTKPLGGTKHHGPYPLVFLHMCIYEFRRGRKVVWALLN
jgi:hypothetical protein